MNANPSEETATSTCWIPLRCSSESRYSTLELIRITRGSEMVRRRQSKNRPLISKTSNVAESGNRSSSALVIAPVPAPNSTAMRVLSRGSGSSMAFAKYFELGEIAPTMGKLASASPINILRLISSYRRDTFALAPASLLPSTPLYEWEGPIFQQMAQYLNLTVYIEDRTVGMWEFLKAWSVAARA